MNYSDIKDSLIINSVNKNLCCDNYFHIVNVNVPAIDANFIDCENFCDYDNFPEGTSYHEDCSIASIDTFSSDEQQFNYKLPHFSKNQTKRKHAKRVTIKHPCLVVKRNARERCRVRAVNDAYARLREIVPSLAARNKRVSKVKTLQRAIQYIKDLLGLLNYKTMSNEKSINAFEN